MPQKMRQGTTTQDAAAKRQVVAQKMSTSLSTTKEVVGWGRPTCIKAHGGRQQGWPLASLLNGRSSQRRSRKQRVLCPTAIGWGCWGCSLCSAPVISPEARGADPPVPKRDRGVCKEQQHHISHLLRLTSLKDEVRVGPTHDVGG